jgi:hypothetical protein
MRPPAVRAAADDRLAARPALSLARDRALVVAAAAALAALVLILTDATPLLRGPAPYPPEWRWELRPDPSAARVLPAAAGGAALVAVLALLAYGTAAAPSPRVVLAAALPLGLNFHLALMAVEPEGAWRTLAQRTTSRTVTSYYTVALSPMAEDARAFLSHHHELLPEMRRGAKHASTHPPGPVLYYRGLAGALDMFPGLAGRVVGAAGGAEPERRPAARAAALIGPVLLIAACVLAAWPVAGLARLAGADEHRAAAAGILWLLLPGPALQAPQFDQALALPVALSALALALAVRDERPRARALLGLGAGLSAALASFLSYGAALFVVVAGAPALAAVAVDARHRRAVAPVLGWAAAGAAAFYAPLLALGHHPVRSALTALAIHRDGYTAPRSYPAWLVFNPLDLALFAGVPVAVVFGAALLRSVRAARRDEPAPADRFTLAVAAGLTTLLLSGTVRGEVGRIWIPLMPVVLVAAATHLRRAAAPLMGALLVLLCLALRVRWEVG